MLSPLNASMKSREAADEVRKTRNKNPGILTHLVVSRYITMININAANIISYTWVG
jgi:hypothetical protein